MLMTISTTHSPATDLGYLLYKNPAKAQSFDLSFGQAHVFYPEASESRCTAALLVEVDPVGLVRKRRGPAGEGFALEQYVNDRPYVASSFLSVAIAEVFGSALSGKCRERPALVSQAIPFEVRIASLPCRGGEALLRSLFEPIGYAVRASRHPLDERFPDWGDGLYFNVQLAATVRLHDLLSHLYVLLPVLDADKHYWIGEDEVGKLLRHGEGWLPSHPSREAIVQRYLKRRGKLVDLATSRLLEQAAPDEEVRDEPSQEGTPAESPPSLNEQRLAAVMQELRACEAESVLDLGCSYGNLLKRLLEDRQFKKIVGVDVSHRALEIAAERLHLDRLPEKQRARIELLHGSLGYRDARLSGYDAAAFVEVIEHLDPARLAAFERVLFEFARPKTIVMTTPNVEFNVRFDTLAAGAMRHRDHRFEWTRGQFERWGTRVAEQFDYQARFVPIGPVDAEVGGPTQMGVFRVRA